VASAAQGLAGRLHQPWYMTKDQLLRAADMSPERMDELPFGAIVIDAAGTILRYNQFESQLAKLDAQRVIGKNFFRDIAPCTAVKAFEGRLEDFVASDERMSVTFDFRFAFAHGPVDVAVTFMKMHGEDTFLIAVEHLPSASG
jgi:photoactive yellow protein